MGEPQAEDRGEEDKAWAVFEEEDKAWAYNFNDVRIWKSTPFGNDLATIKYDKVKAVKVWSWVCVSFSSLSATKILEFSSKLVETCVSLGMDISPEPTMFIHSTTYSHHTTDMKNNLLIAREFFCDQIIEQAKLLVILRDDAEYSDGNLDDICEIFGATSHNCSPKLNQKYLMDAASEIMFKILKFTAYNMDSSDEHTEEEDASDSSEELPLGMDCELSHSYKKEIAVEESSTRKRKHDDLQVDSLDEMEDGSKGLPLGMDVELSHNDKNNIHGAPSENWQQHEKSLTNKRKLDDTDNLQVTNGTVVDWACVCFAPLPKCKVRYFSEKLRERCVSIGMDFYPYYPEVFFMKKPARFKEIERMLWTVYDKYSANSDTCKMDLLTVILPQAKDFHEEIADLCSHMGVVCQYFMPMSAISRHKKYLQKAAREIKTKVVELQTRLATGRLQPFALKPIPFAEPTIIFGAYIVHTRFQFTAASLVASRNWPRVTKYTESSYYSRGFVGVPRHIQFNVVRNYLVTFHEENMARAERIIFFRHLPCPLTEDIIQYDVSILRQACQGISQEYQPRITYIAVSRDKSAVSTNKSKDIGPAPVGDVPLKSTMFELSCGHGTVKENDTAHYCVYLNENDFGPDVLQSLCLNLCTCYDPATALVLPAQLAAYGAEEAVQRSSRPECDCHGPEDLAAMN